MPKCQQCGRIFKVTKRHRSGKFCKASCYHDYRRLHRYQPVKKCPNCGQEFVVKYQISRQAIDKIRFCSLKCARQAVIWNRGLTKAQAPNLRGGCPVGIEPWNKGKRGCYSQETLEKIAAGSKSWKRSEEHLRKLREGRRLKGFTEEWRQKISQALREVMKQKWQDPNFRQAQIEKWLRGNKQRPTKPEIKLKALLDSHFPGEWKYTGDGSHTIGGFPVDFTNINGKKAVIELFGDYWHNRPNLKWHQTELGRIMACNSLGFRCLVIWEYELKDKSLVVDKVRQFILRKRQHG